MWEVVGHLMNHISWARDYHCLYRVSRAELHSSADDNPSIQRGEGCFLARVAGVH